MVLDLLLCTCKGGFCLQALFSEQGAGAVQPQLSGFQLTLQFFTALPSVSASFPEGDLTQVLPCEILDVFQLLVWSHL